MRDFSVQEVDFSDRQQALAFFDEAFSHTLAGLSSSDTPQDVLFGETYDSTIQLREKLKTSTASTSRFSDVIASLKDNTLEELAAVSHFENIAGIANTAAYVRASDEQTAEMYNETAFKKALKDPKQAEELIKFYGSEDPKRMARRAYYAQDLKNKRALGVSVDDIRGQIDNRKVWETFTPHPTKDKNDDGQQGFNTIAHDNPEETYEAFADMAKKPLTPRVKDELQDETNTGLNNLDTYIDGMLDYIEDMQWALDHALGEETFDLRDTEIDLAPRDWYAGDADGKLVKAAVLFSKRLQGAQRASRKYIQILKSVPKEEREPLLETIEAFESLAFRLSEIKTEPKALLDENPAKKGSGEPLLKQAIEDFDEAFEGAGFLGLSEHIGPSWTGAIMTRLRKVEKSEEASPKAKAAAYRATSMHKQVGVSLGRQEIRHSGKDYNQIFENVYSYLADNPDRVPGLKIKKGSTLSELSDEQQIAFYVKFIGAENRRELLRDANEGKLSGPTAEVLDRFEVVQKTFNKRRTGVAIIAEANPMSCIQQQILAEAHHIQGMTHCALNEDETTIMDAAKNLRLYLETTGQNNLNFKIEEIDQGADHPKVYVCVMDPASDSHKSYGVFMKAVQNDSWAEVSALGEKFGVAALVKIGTGLSYARGGFPAEMAPRLHLHALDKTMDLQGLSENSRKILKRQMSLVSLTIQGRGPGILRGTPGQVQDALAKIGFEIDAACMAIDGMIDPKLVAPLAPRYSHEMKAFLATVKQEARDHYHYVMRGEGGKEERAAYFATNPTQFNGMSQERFGETIENIHVDQTSTTMMALLTNVSARKAARDDDDKKIPVLKNKDTGEQRAIGQNVVKERTESKYDGWFEVGMKLTRTRQALGEQVIKKTQVSKLANDQFFLRHECGNAMLALADADCEAGFDSIAAKKGTLGDERWTVGKVIQAVDNNYEGLDEAEARQVLIAYEALLATSHMEWLLTDGKSKQPPKKVSEKQVISRLYKKDDTLEKLKFGKRTKKMYPGIEITQETSQRSKLARAIAHEGERRLREMAAKGKFLQEGSPELQKYRHIAMTCRTAAGPITMPNLMDTPGVTFGARDETLFDIVDRLARQADISNDNRPDQGPEPEAVNQ